MGTNCTVCHAPQEPQMNDAGVYRWKCTACGEPLSWIPSDASPEYMAAWKRELLRDWGL